MRSIVISGALAACALSATLFAPAPAEAGVIILNNGNVITGRIRKEEDTAEFVTMRWPYKHLTHRGHQKYEHGSAPHNIRWHRRNTEKQDYDQPTDEYWERYEDVEKYPIDPKFMALRERWLLKRKRQEDSNEGLVVIDDPLTKGPRLHPIPVDAGSFKVQKPEGWSSLVEDNIWIFQAKEAREGYHPRIHVFAGPAVIGQADDQLQWFESRMKRVADDFEVKDKAHLKTRPGGGFDQVMSTRSVVRNRPVMALRKVFFRKKHTYFFTAYCHESEFPELRALFERCMASMRINEDLKPQKKAPKKPAAKKPATKTP